jgi:hypothetical protein
MPFLSKSTHFITRVDLDIFDGIALIHQNKRYFVVCDKLFFEKSIGTHFCLFWFTSMRPIVLYSWKKLAEFHVQKANLSKFYFCPDIWMDSS